MATSEREGLLVGVPGTCWGGGGMHLRAPRSSSDTHLPPPHPQQIMKDKWINIGYEGEELKPYTEPEEDFTDTKRIGEGPALPAHLFPGAGRCRAVSMLPLASARPARGFFRLPLL